jgi:PAS domain S-box-containing protein
MISNFILLSLLFFLGLWAGSRKRGEQKPPVSISAAVLKDYKESYENTKEKYDLLMDNIAASIVVRDAENKIIFCSPFTEVLTGYSVNEVYRYDGDFFIFISHEEDRQNIERALKVASCGEAFQYRFRFYHKTGILMWAETRTVPILDSSGEVEASLSITLDVTGSVLYQKQVEEKNRDLHDFTYMISHDLKAPIYTIKGMHGVLKEEITRITKNPEITDPLDHISSAALRLERLVANVLEYSKLNAQDFPSDRIELKTVLSEVLRDYEPKFTEDKVSVKIPENLPAVLSNKDALYQIFSNLIGNAVKYKSAERNLIIEIILKETKNTRLIELGVIDNGSGIPRDKLETIFRPFQRAHSNVEGSGIGLASVKKLLDKTGGHVRAESNINQGSAFFVTLRCA